MRSQIQLMARHGTTTVEVKTGCGQDSNAEMKLFRALAGLKRDPLDVIPTHLLRLPRDGGDAGAAEAAEWAARELLPKLRRRRVARFADVALEDDAGRIPHLKRHMDAARALGFPLKVHADGPGATASVTAAVERFAATIDHMEHATAAEAALLAGSCTIATLLPGAAFQHGGPEAPARALIDAGAPVALASNFNPQDSPMLSMQTVVALACLRLRMTPAEAVVAATINGAHALGRGDKTGSLEPGKLADVVILNASDYRDLARDFGANLVRMTMKRGEFIYREGEVARRDDPFKNLSSKHPPGMRQ
jgi:imidazolonepropionase